MIRVHTYEFETPEQVREYFIWWYRTNGRQKKENITQELKDEYNDLRSAVLNLGFHLDHLIAAANPTQPEAQ